LKDNNENIIKDDWIIVYENVKNGKAHELSETLCKILAPSRSGSGGKDKNGRLRDLVIQPNKIYQEFALKRAFSLKSSFTNQRWNELNNKKYESIIDNNNIKINNFEDVILKKLQELENLMLKDVANKFNIKIPKGKNAAATIVKKALGFKNVNARIKEFEQYGIQVKVIPLRLSDYKPWEAVSFPTFKFKELIKEKFYSGEKDGEEWDDCSLLKEINRILFIPIIRDKKEGTPLEKRRIGKSFFWSPSNEQLEIIEKEWKNYIQEIKDGKVEVDIIPIKNVIKK
jgi:DNA mismatch repair endonuclease MutH